ncbi:hypothetical protein ACPOL_1994 [Acidisarcina polymorpha]|uniref:Uncharacterized protein n=1 Tax=Acidisarcina polymorpha TaxID=2211140 RepID=A0A2Z5FX83_9BACT|nr:hypothetical protein ACPOL_1994 [Acidisarcina polymorpha]
MHRSLDSRQEWHRGPLGLTDLSYFEDVAWADRNTIVFAFTAGSIYDWHKSARRLWTVS